jgi:hypothetical protein
MQIILIAQCGPLEAMETLSESLAVGVDDKGII